MARSAEIKGAKELIKKLSKINKGVDKEVEQALFDIANKMRNYAVDQMTTPSPGRIYTRGTVTHQASLPGDFPNVDTGVLLGGLFADEGKLQARFGVQGVPYAKRLEFGFVGADSKGRLYAQEPRPFIQPAFDKFKGDIAKEVDKILSKYLNKF